MLTVKMQSAQFFTGPRTHMFTFLAEGDNGVSFTIPLAVDNIEGGATAVHDRAWENLGHLANFIREIADSNRQAAR